VQAVDSCDPRERARDGCVQMLERAAAGSANLDQGTEQRAGATHFVARVTHAACPAMTIA
jgi:hypothetical protein